MTDDATVAGEGVDQGPTGDGHDDGLAQPRPVARPAGFGSDVWTVAGRTLRSLPRAPALLAPALIVPIFLFAANIGALQDVAEQIAGVDFKAFQLPVAVIFAVTGVSRASGLVLDIQGGYLDRMLASPVSRPALLVGLMVADIVLALALSVAVTGLALAVGVRFATGVGGMALFLVMASLWGLAFTGFPYTVALRTGNPAAVTSSLVLFLPFALLTSALVPLDAMTGWLQSIARWNPVTYLLDGMRALVSGGWRWGDIAGAFAAIGGVAAVSFSLAFATLGDRVRRG